MPIRIVLADDHTMIRQGLKVILEAEGFDVPGEAGNGVEAIALCQRLRPDVAVLDISMPVDLATLDPSVAQTLSDFRAVRSVQLCSSEDLCVPTAVGFFRPSVVLPNWALTELTPAELNAVLLHEFAHLQRWDDWTNLAQKVLRALFFFHPAVWFVENRLSLEREMAWKECGSCFSRTAQ